MRTHLLHFALFGLFSLAVKGQSQYRTGISGFYIPERNSLNIGFTSFDLHCPLISREKFTVDYGLRFIGAAAGKRGGYFAFGYFSELLFRRGRVLMPGINVAFLGGGGAAAPDHDGWLLQGTAFAQYDFKRVLALRAGINYAYVAEGEISGISPMIGLNWKLRSANSADSISEKGFVWTAAYGEVGAAIFNDKNLGIIGAGSKYSWGHYFSGDVMIHAITNVHGGYMHLLLSGGPDLSYRSFHISPALLVGLGGGGGVPTKGGALYGGQLAAYYSGSTFFAGVKYQHMLSYSRAFNYRGVLASVGRSLQADEDGAIGFDLVTKAYLGKYGFGNLGARFTAFRYRQLRLLGSTYWAFTHDMGAYAEGLFEATLEAPRSWPFYLIVSMGAGAGSGINQRKAAFMYAGGLGYALPFQDLPLSVECAYWEGGNLPEWGVTLSYQIGRSQHR